MPQLPENQRIVITGVGLTAPGASNLADFRANLLTGTSGISTIDLRYMGIHPAGLCQFAETRYRKKRENKRGTRAGCIGVYCANEALADAGLNNPAGEITMNLEITGPHYSIGAACAAGNAALIQGVQMLRLGEVELALCGGISECVGSFGIFASFQAQGALAEHPDPTRASRPFDRDRNGIVISEGGCVFVLERLDRALARNAAIYGEITGYAMNTDARDFVLPYGPRQQQCMEAALRRAGRAPADITIVNTHATGTKQGDIEECNAIRNTFAGCASTWINNTKSSIGHAMGAAGVLELAGNLPAFKDYLVHPTINLDNLDPDCALPNLVANQPRQLERVDAILNNSFGMLGINSVVIVERFVAN